MIKLIKELFDWKKYPDHAFIFAIPLFVIGIGSLGIKAYLMWKLYGDIWYAVILAAGLGLLVVGLYPIRKQLFKSNG